MATTVNNIRKGNVIQYNGEPCLVIECVVRTPPNLRAFCQMSMRNLKTGKVIHNRTNANDSYEVLHKEISNYEFSYEAQGTFHFLHPETYEPVEMTEDMVGDTKEFLVTGQNYSVMFVDGAPIGIELPPSVQMKVVSAPDAIRGDTSGNVQKTVILETGMSLRTPIFIKEGDVVKVNTEERSYLGRV
ncbi:MAG: elongation factor P [Opitutales bacterium]|nr:elongation factor P [Opitutales bacterium]